MREKQLNLRLTIEDYQKLEQASLDLGLSISATVRIILKGWHENNMQKKIEELAILDKISLQVEQIKKQNETLVLSSKLAFCTIYGVQKDGFRDDKTFQKHYQEAKESFDITINKGTKHD